MPSLLSKLTKTLSILTIAAIIFSPALTHPAVRAQEELINADVTTSSPDVTDPTVSVPVDTNAVDVNAEEPVLLDDITNGDVVNLDELDEATIADLMAGEEVAETTEPVQTTSALTEWILLGAAIVLLTGVVYLTFRKKKPVSPKVTS
jgi:hypothetical protein